MLFKPLTPFFPKPLMPFLSDFLDFPGEFVKLNFGKCLANLKAVAFKFGNALGDFRAVVLFNGGAANGAPTGAVVVVPDGVGALLLVGAVVGAGDVVPAVVLAVLGATVLPTAACEGAVVIATGAGNGTEVGALVVEIGAGDGALVVVTTGAGDGAPVVVTTGAGDGALVVVIGATGAGVGGVGVVADTAFNVNGE